MSLRVIGAGLGRTGTHSLKLALERLLDGPCYHMIETFGRPDDFAVWRAAADGTLPDWPSFLAGYRATVDWPAAAFWRELSAAYPNALILLSVRDADAWWTSANATIFQVNQRDAQPEQGSVAEAQLAMARTMLAKRFTPDLANETEAKRAYEAHNAAVRATIPPERLLEWHPGDGWQPICDALDLALPDEPFPHVNTTDEFRARAGLT
ncbi:MAG TPA: sulfotransferase [Acidimicrobiia bacterium]